MLPESALLQSGLEVSAKFKGAYCEAKIKSVYPNIKLKIRLSDGKSVETSHKNCVGNIANGGKVYYHGKVGFVVRLKDVSTYTVVFDDGDEKTLKRGSLCIKGQRHFDESVTLDSLPLTDPEHFGNNVPVNKDNFPLNMFNANESHADNDEETDSCSAENSDNAKNNSLEQQSSGRIRSESGSYSTNEVIETLSVTKLNQEFSFNQEELDELEGPEERINMIEFHLIFLSNKYQHYKKELQQIDRIRKKRKSKLREEESIKELKLSQ